MTRRECLDKAAECVLQDRNNSYGKPEDCFESIAMMWSAYLGKIIQGWDVAAMMALLKVARIKANPAHADNWCDLAGYAACGAECHQKFEAEMKKTVEDAFETFPYLQPEAEGGCCQNGNDQPKFKPGDKVLVTMPEGEDVPCVYVGESTHPGCCCVRYLSGDNSGDTDDTVPTDQIRCAPAPKAEGCEALVEKDAPQTAQELCKRIIDANPATFHTPSYAEEQLEHHSRLQAHKPTGEEEEDEKHG